MIDTDLSALPQHVRDALERFSDMLSHSAIVNPDNEAADKDALQTIRAELLRLTGVHLTLRAERIEALAETNRMRERAERAESELAALRKAVNDRVDSATSAMLRDAIFAAAESILTVTDEEGV